jgi:hypothetical protein
VTMPASAEDILIRRRTVIDLGVSDRSLRRNVSAGRLVTVAPGVFMRAEKWAGLEPIEQHRMRVLATAGRVGADVVYSHHAAAALWDIRMLGSWPSTIDVSQERASGGRSNGMIRRHCRGLDGVEITTLDGLVLTTPAQTVADLALKLPFANAVASMDSALHRKRRLAPLMTMGDLAERVGAMEGVRGWRRAAVAAGFATDLSDSVEESHSRVQIFRLGFPTPILQHCFTDAEGFVADTDFYWLDFHHAGESDGNSKYLNPELRNGMTPGEVVIAEKKRENRLRRLVHTLSRWDPADLYPPARLYRILTEAGLPTSGPRFIV